MRSTVIALLLLLSGATTAGAQTAKAQAPQGHCAVGVISNLGQKFRVEEHGLLSKVTAVPVGSWHLDDLVVDKIRNALGNRVAVQRIRYRNEAFAMRTVLWWRVPDYTATIRTLATGTRCARYIFVREGIEEVGDGPSDVGIAIVKTIFGGAMHAVIDVTVYDGETFKTLGHSVNDSVRGSIQLFRTAHPKRLVDDSFWPDPASRAEQNTKLREMTRELVAESLDKTLLLLQKRALAL